MLAIAPDIPLCAEGMFEMIEAAALVPPPPTPYVELAAPVLPMPRNPPRRLARAYAAVITSRGIHTPWVAQRMTRSPPATASVPSASEHVCIACVHCGHGFAGTS